MFSIMLIVIMAVVGAAVDYSRLEKSQTKLQDISDGLTLAAAIGLSSEEFEKSKLNAYAKTYLEESNMPNVEAVWKIENGELAFTLSGSETMKFMGMFGQPEKSVRAITKVPLSSSRGLSLALVLDTTYSMRGTRMPALQTAANDLIDLLSDTGQEDSYVSVVPFSQMVKIPVSNENAVWFDKPDSYSRDLTYIDPDRSVNCRSVWTGERRERICDEYVYVTTRNEYEWQGCMLSRNSGYHKVPEFAAQRFKGHVQPGYCSRDDNTLTPMTNDMQVIKSAINDLKTYGETYIPSGLIWGWRTLRSDEPFTEAKNASEDLQKVMVLMTDGANFSSLGNVNTSYNAINHEGTDIDAADKLSAELCESIKKDDILVYTIALEVDDTATVNMLRNCASSASHFFDVKNTGGLSSVFKGIGTQVSEIRLSH